MASLYENQVLVREPRIGVGPNLAGLPRWARSVTFPESELAVLLGLRAGIRRDL